MGTIKSSLKFIIMFLVLLSLTGCVRLPATKVENIRPDSKLLVMPPLDVVQNGRPHIAGSGSGKYLQDSVIFRLGKYSNYQVMAFAANNEFSHTTPINREKAIIETEKLGFDYCLLLSLGEFQNAAPFTFRPDYVYLNDAVLIDVRSRKEVWYLRRRFLRQKGNLGNHYPLIDQIADLTAKSLKSIAE
ncbi:hypothetical protein ACFLR3_00500 [Campylobacterota bacterium]